MAKDTTPKIDDDVQYKVDLKKVIKVGRVSLRPGEAVTLKGKTLKEHLDAVTDFRPLDS